VVLGGVLENLLLNEYIDIKTGAMQDSAVVKCLLVLDSCSPLPNVAL
jgi:hypothetical protein